MLGAAACALAACHGTSAPPVLSIDSFVPSMGSIPIGGSVVLSWQVKAADALSIDNDVGDVTGRTSISVSPTHNTTYTLTATSKANPQGVQKTTTVFVAVVSAQIVYFTAVPSQIAPGTPVTLYWHVDGAASLTVNGQPVVGSSLQVTPSATTTYSLAALGHTGSIDPPPAKAVVRVVSAPSIGSFTASPATLVQGATTLLSWTGTGLGYSLDNGVGDLGTLTHATVRPVQTTTYALTARGPAGLTSTVQQTVTVTPAAGARSLVYTPPAGALGAALLLVADASSTSSVAVLKLVTAQAAQASALAFGLALDASKVALDAVRAGDVSPGFVVTTALDPGANPAAAKASLRADGPLANVLVLGLANKPPAGDSTLPAGTEICRFRLVLAPGAGPGIAFPLAADSAHPDPSDAYKPYKALLRSGQAPSSTLPGSKVSVGVLAVQ